MPTKKEKPGTIEIKSVSENVAHIKYQLKKPTDRLTVLLTSDRHHDHVDCRRDMEKRHLEECRKRGGIIVDIGDLFCAMQGRKDFRGGKKALDPELKKEDYFDALVDQAEKFYKPYADMFAVLGTGNHETGILKHNETNLTKRLVGRLKKHGSPCVLGGYSGFVRFQLVYGTTSISIPLWYFHGSGGDAPMSFGTLSVKRLASQVPDARIIATGHSHNHWLLPLPRVRLSPAQNKVYHDEQLHIKVGTYKDEYKQGIGGWHVERGGMPKPVGQVWLKLGMQKTDKKGINPIIEPERAI